MNISSINGPSTLSSSYHDWKFIGLTSEASVAELLLRNGDIKRRILLTGVSRLMVADILEDNIINYIQSVQITPDNIGDALGEFHAYRSDYFAEDDERTLTNMCRDGSCTFVSITCSYGARVSAVCETITEKAGFEDLWCLR